MQRSLYTGVSGLTNHQSILDTTANNLANISTPGYKGSRLSFATALTQTSFAGASPSASVGGVNPRQVGLGVASSSVDVDMRQGALLSTGRSLDLAIQGNGFFQVSDGTRSFYTRVGNFGFDKDNSIVDLSSGKKLIGNLFDPANPALPSAFNVPITVPAGGTLQPLATSAIDMQGNLSAKALAIQGDTVQSLFPLTDESSGDAASDSTVLSDLSIFKDAVEPATPAASMRHLHLFGTQPNGTGWSGAISFNPWHETVGDLVSRMNTALVSGGNRFGLVSLSNGNLVAQGIGAGGGFSLYLGDAITSGASNEVLPATTGLTDATGSAYTGATVNTTVVLGTAQASTTPDVPVTIPNVRLAPTVIMPAIDYSGSTYSGQTLTVTVQNLTTATTLGTITIPAADYSDPDVARSFTLAALPQIARTDNIRLSVNGNLDLGAGNNLTWSTAYIDPTNTDAFIADTDNDRVVDMFDADQTTLATDANAWQYQDSSNAEFNWYRSRFTPESRTTSFEVYDSLGGKHILEARMFRNGSKTDPNDPAAKRSSWDLIVGVRPGEATIVDDYVAGIEFDNEGRFTGEFGKTLKGNTLSDLGYAGDPSSRTIQLDWDLTGTASPATIDLNLGSVNSTDGLTGYGSISSATGKPNGYADGTLDTISVSSSGELVGLYTNGQSLRLAQLQIATFSNPTGLINAGSNLWIDSPNSGSAIVRSPGEGGAGTIASGSLEGSNVDIASEFTRLITAQRGFQVNARVIQTTDSVLQELAGLIR